MECSETHIYIYFLNVNMTVIFAKNENIPTGFFFENKIQKN